MSHPAAELHDEYDADEAHERPGDRKRAQKKWWITGTLGVLLMSLLAGWFALSASQGVTYQQAGFKIISNSAVDVRWDVTAKEKRPVTCTLITLNDKRDVLGTKVVNLPVSKYESTRYSQVVKTTSRAVTGTVKECHYTGERTPNQ